MKRLVIEKFSHVDKKQLALRKLSTIKQGADEPASKYIDRFVELKYDADLEDNDVSALFAFGQGIRQQYKPVYSTMCPLWKVDTLPVAYNLLRTLDAAQSDPTTL